MIETVCQFQTLLEAEPECFAVGGAQMEVTIGCFEAGEIVPSLWLLRDKGGWFLRSYDEEGKTIKECQVALGEVSTG